ncbi:Diphosphomevalonate/phosphomevalonate decarboxylase like protein [Aduncisulcus paluster]|uniref:Diphosphomevalonate decarboxylase n=1 Tax=Aduncisulcus paluster TaxID=2918883 RepID=A0ABQ5KWP7_9EUKA|nr:Diphosphomevalonate/phosphomevalonate decarboxylase like protein [Aduncisulcus paluster]
MKPIYKHISTIANPNIAIVKYWGKQEGPYNLPLNGSISFGLDDQFITETHIYSDVKESKYVINGIDVEECPALIRGIFEAIEVIKSPSIIPPLHIHSTNNFPTKSGLASSAAAAASISLALCTLFDIPDSDISSIARCGSGSGARSILGGLCELTVQKKEIPQISSFSCDIKPLVKSSTDKLDDKHSPFISRIRGTSISPIHSLLTPLFRVIVYKSDRKCEAKTISSRQGMIFSKKTSLLLSDRVERIVPVRMRHVRAALEAGNASELFKLMIMDSNNFHAICLDTFPPLRYISDASWKIAEAVLEIGHDKCGYTFDAGDHCVVLTLEKFLEEVISFISSKCDRSPHLISSIGKGTRITKCE